MSIPLASLIMAGIGWFIEVVLIRRVYDRTLAEQLLLKYALVLITGDVIKETGSRGPDRCKARGGGGSHQSPYTPSLLTISSSLAWEGLWRGRFGGYCTEQFLAE